jgi:pyrroloquinoline quinone biosynthesis protein B
VPFSLYATKSVLAVLKENSVFNVLGSEVRRSALPLNKAVVIAGGLAVEAFAVPGKTALYLEEGDSPARADDTVGLKVSASQGGASFFYIPGCAEAHATLAARLRGAFLVLFDGTLYTEEEMIAQGLSQKTGRRMGHISISGPEGSMAALAALGIGRRIYVHINNSNPVLDAASSERALVERAGWEVAFDGMEIRL